MRRALVLAGLLCLMCAPAWARQRAYGFCEEGGERVRIGALLSTSFVQESYPQCTVTVYLTGTTNKANLYSDNSGTPKANPFTLSKGSNGYWFFYADSGRYDVNVGGTGVVTPITYADILLCDGCGGGGGGGVGIQVNGGGIAGLAANFNNTIPAAPASAINVLWLADNSSPTNVSASVPLSSSSIYGVLRLNGDLGGLAITPQVIATHLSAPLPASQGGTGQNTLTGLFNAIAPATALGGIIVGNGVNSYSNLPIGTAGQCPTPLAGQVVWQNCYVGSTALLVLNNQSNVWTTGTQDMTAVGHTLPIKSGLTASLPATCTFTAGVAMEVYLATDATPGQNEYFCTAANTWTQQLNSGAAGANQQLANLSAVAFNVALLPANGVVGTSDSDLGSTTNPIQDLYIGRSSGNSTQVVRVGGIGNFIVTIPPVTGNVILDAGTQTLSGTKTLSAVAKISSSTGTPATTGWLNLASADTIRQENNAGSGGLNIVSKSSADVFTFADVAGSSFQGPVQLTAAGLITSSGFSNDSTNPMAVGSTVCATSTGTARICQTNDTQVLGMAITNPSSATPIVAKIGFASCVFDNTATPGDKAVLSTGFVGQCHDAGTAGSGTGIGVVMANVSGSTYKIDVQIGAGSGSISGVVLNPSTSQRITSSSSTAVPLQLQCNVASSVNCFEIYQANGTLAFKVDQNGVATFGNGVGNVTAGHFVSASSNPASGAASNVIQLATSDLVALRNNGNTGDITLGLDTSNNVKLTGTTGIKIAGPSWTFNSLLSFAQPGQATTYTVDDPGSATAHFAFLAIPQTFSNKTIDGTGLVFQESTAPANPASGNELVYADSTTHVLTCLKSDGSNCLSGGGGAAGAWSALTNPSGGLALTMGNNASVFTSGTNTPAGAWDYLDTTANTSVLPFVRIHTVGTSTALPFQVTAKGTSNGFQVNSSAELKLMGTGTVDTAANAITEECLNEGVTGTVLNKVAKLTTANPQTCIVVAITDVANVEGIVNSNAGIGPTVSRIVIAGTATCVFDNQTVDGDYAVVSTGAGTPGDCSDVANVTAGQQPLGRVTSVNSGAGTTATVNVAGRNAVAIAGTVNQVIVTPTGNSLILALPQDIGTTSAPTFNNVKLNGGGVFSGTGPGANINFKAATSQAANIAGLADYGNGNQSGASNTANNGGSVIFHAGDNANTAGAGTAGSLTIRTGAATGAANHNGWRHDLYSYIKGGTFTVGNVICIAVADETVSDCATSSVNFIGIADSTNGNAGYVTHEGNQITVNLQGSEAFTRGNFVCMSTTVAGTGHTQAGICSAGATIGIAENSATASTVLVTYQHY